MSLRVYAVGSSKRFLIMDDEEGTRAFSLRISDCRERLFDELAAKGTLIAGAHMQFPSLGRLRKDGVGYAWVPVLYSDRP